MQTLLPIIMSCICKRICHFNTLCIFVLYRKLMNYCFDVYLVHLIPKMHCVPLISCDDSCKKFCREGKKEEEEKIAVCFPRLSFVLCFDPLNKTIEDLVLSSISITH